MYEMLYICELAEEGGGGGEEGLENLLRLWEVNGIERLPFVCDSIASLSSEVSNYETWLFLIPETREGVSEMLFIKVTKSISKCMTYLSSKTNIRMGMARTSHSKFHLPGRSASQGIQHSCTLQLKGEHHNPYLQRTVVRCRPLLMQQHLVTCWKASIRDWFV